MALVVSGQVPTSPAASAVTSVVLSPRNEVAGSVAYAVKLTMRTFLEPKHYRALHRILSEHWSGCHSLTAALTLMKAHGVKLTKEEEDRLRELPEDRMIEALVQRMPTQTPEQFEHFFLQLSFIASTTTRLRMSLESGQPESIEEVLESADNVGVLPYLLKMAVSQAGQEVKACEETHESWLEDTDKRMAPLLMISATVVAIEKELAQARALIEQYQSESRDKAHVVLQGICDANDRTLLATSFLAFHDIVKRLRREEEHRQGYQAQLKAIHEKRVHSSEAKAESMKVIMGHHFREEDLLLLSACFEAFKEDAEKAKHVKMAARSSEQIQVRIKAVASTARANAKNYLKRVCEDTDSGKLVTCMQAWKDFHGEARKEKHVKVALQDRKEQLAEFVKKQKQGAKNVLASMISQSATALQQTAFRAWVDWAKAQKADNAKVEVLQARTVKCTQLADRQKGKSINAAEKVARLLEQQSLLFALTFWKRETKVERMRRLGKEKNDKRKRELVGVKGLFKNFANELETSLQTGTPRIELSKPRKPLNAA